jgi:hypothetical protein
LDSKVAWYENLSLTLAAPAIPANTLSLYPNPMTNITTVVLAQAGGTVLVQLFDPQGRSIRSVQQVVQEHRITVTRDGLPPGLYLVRITGTERSEAKLFVE